MHGGTHISFHNSYIESPSNHNSLIDEASSEVARIEVGIFLSCCHGDIPHLFPGAVE